MDHQVGEAVRVGDTVVYRNYDTRITGVVLEYLYDECVRVAWSDFSQPTTHHIDSLKRITG
jgi:hypothetical protein